MLTRHTFGLKGSPFVACRSLQKIIENSNELPDEWKQLIWKSFYMDDLVVAMDNVVELENMVSKLRQTLSPYFKLTKFDSNWEELAIKFKDERQEMKRILGISYSKDDSFEWDLSPFKLKETVTYSEMNSALMRVFDPLGLIEPIRANFKVIWSKAQKTMENNDWKG